jgi:DNA-binding NarL/FixJ family response regulator
MPIVSIPVRLIGRHLLINEALGALISLLPGMAVVEKMTCWSDLQALPVGSDLLVWFYLPAEQDEVLAWLQQNPQSRVLLISSGWTGERIRTALHAGAAGCVNSHANLQEVGEAIRQIDHGEIYLSPDLTRTLILESTAEVTGLQGLSVESLTPREKELIQLICQGYSNKQIAQTLYLSVRTVENHLANIFTKLGAHSRTEVALLAVQSGWVEVSK